LLLLVFPISLNVEGVEETGANRKGFGSVDTLLERLQAQPPAQQTKLRVLVVDDRADCTESMSLLLTLYGFQVDVAGACAGAESAVIAHQPDVVLMDIGLPGCDGYAVTKHLRSLCQKKPLLIALTGYGAASDRKRSEDEGFDHHLVKPVDPQHLEKLLRSYAGALRRS
jgi:CheY-like chemotaxis protein